MSSQGSVRYARKPSLQVSSATKLVRDESSKINKSLSRKTSIFLPQFKDNNPKCQREYRCLSPASPSYEAFQTQADFSKFKYTADEMLMMPNTLTTRTLGSRSLGPQIFLVSLAADIVDWSECEETGELEMVHIQTQRICKGYYTTGVIHDAPGKTSRKGVLVCQDLVVTDRYAS